MKKFILIGLLLSGEITFGQFRPRISADYFINNAITVVTPVCPSTGISEFPSRVDFGNFRIRMGAAYTYKITSVYFDQNVYMDKTKGVAFRPLQAEWYAGLKFKIYKGVTLSYEHACFHPIVSRGTYEERTKLYGGYNMFSISYGY